MIVGFASMVIEGQQIAVYARTDVRAFDVSAGL